MLDPKIEQHNPFQTKLYLSTKEGVYLIEFNNILRAEASSNYCQIYLKNGAKHMMTKSLKYLLSKLPEKFFLRIHSSHIVNVTAITFIARNNLTLSDGTEVPISKSFKSKLKELLELIR